MARRRSKQDRTFFPVKIPIHSLSGGVGRQAPSKRLPNEVEDMTNMFCTSERSIDKRNGFEICDGLGSDLGIEDADSKDMWWYWYIAGNEQRFLIGIDHNASNSDLQLLYVYRVHEDGRISEENVDDNLSTDVRNYLVFGGGEPQKKLRACAVGASTLILNTEVKAGFTSDGTSAYEFNLDGTQNFQAVDDVGKKEEYSTAISVDPEGTAEIWTSFTDYVWGRSAIDTDDPVTTPSGFPSYYKIYNVKSGITSANLPGPNTQNILRPKADDTRWNYDRTSKVIPVEDYVYPDPTNLYLGQAVARFSDLKFPPGSEDVTAFNNAEGMLKALYTTGNANGKGKIYYLSQAYLESTPGWYRVINSSTTPYLSKVRTPHQLGVIDKKRMPVQVYLDEPNNQWSIRLIDWDPRTSGSEKSNKGPSFFTDKEGKARQIEIKAISYYRDRLFIATDDTLVSSRLGDFSNFFLNDPALITYLDPLDLSVSSNIFTPITFLRPFKDFLFLGTSGDTQYELVGSENQISPLTAEIAPTSFFPMTEDVEPMVMNNNLFFFSKKRLFIYFQRFESSGQQAFELSRHVPDYISENFWDTTVSTSHNMILAIEGKLPSDTILCYRNIIRGDEVIQNAFFKFKLGGSGKAVSIKAISDYVYSVITTKDAEGKKLFQIQRMSLIPDHGDIPRLDNRISIDFLNGSFNSESNKTLYDIPINTSDIDQVVFGSGTFIGEVVDASVVDRTAEFNTQISIEGNYLGASSGIVGSKYDSSVTLSDIFYRDQNNNVLTGSLNLRYGITRHRDTGKYDIVVSRKNRAASTYTFDHVAVGARDYLLGGSVFEATGIMKFPIMGFSEDMIIKIESSYPYPMNITNIELTGKFKSVPHFLTT